MKQDRWTAVDEYFQEQLAPHDDVLDATQQACAQAGLPDIAVAPNQGKLLQLLARMIDARTILEIGTLGGYSTIWLARALPDQGRLITLEADATHADVAKSNIERAGLSDRVDVRVGRALDILPTLRDEGPFDLAFIDADKVNNPHYVRWALELGRPGSVIVVDNVVRGGAVIDTGNDDPSVRGTRETVELLRAEPRLDATALQTVGGKGYDGIIIARVVS
ncbi:MAG: O-methyltransferase [Saccharomonospora viridis]|jgi:predicted O-methyltransferase YrrM|uniref:Predicted O-methyltransferase n=2 Tax=Saccharomonospora viridis TaxID=1852 RepID=C7MQ84_SACVD|nr:O-methyltransferase [Saccharomonospora viridis]ACU96383.1 predicted O-methyltransferase [Saccharomonospora viridis DSM 43017]SFO97793.1 Predicted O-methyltransferase YrrM [Saccharomonospora viridis]